MVRTSLIILVVSVLSLAGSAQASQPSSAKATFSKKYQDCMDHAGYVDAQMSICEDDEFARQDAGLNLAYRSLIATLSPVRKIALQKAERAWITFRDAQCEFEASNDANATLGPLVYSSCRKLLTYERKQDLVTR